MSDFRQSDLVATPTGKLAYVLRRKQDGRVLLSYLCGEGQVELRPDLLQLMVREEDDE